MGTHEVCRSVHSVTFILLISSFLQLIRNQVSPPLYAECLLGSKSLFIIIQSPSFRLFLFSPQLCFYCGFSLLIQDQSFLYPLNQKDSWTLFEHISTNPMSYCRFNYPSQIVPPFFCSIHTLFADHQNLLNSFPRKKPIRL